MYIHSCLKFLRRPRVLRVFSCAEACTSKHPFARASNRCLHVQGSPFARAKEMLHVQIARAKDMVAHAGREICTCKIFWPRVPKRIILLRHEEHKPWENIKAIPVQRPCSRYLKVMLAIIVRFNTARSDLYLCQKYLKSFQRSISCECANLALISN